MFTNHPPCLEVEIRGRKRQRRRKRSDAGRHPAVTRTQIPSGTEWVKNLALLTRIRANLLLATCSVAYPTARYRFLVLYAVLRIWFKPYSDPGLPLLFASCLLLIIISCAVPRTKGDFLEFYWINILDIFKSVLFCFIPDLVKFGPAPAPGL